MENCSILSVHTCIGRVMPLILIGRHNFIGWTNVIKDEKLCIYKLGFFETRPEVVTSVTIHEGFSWHLLYRKHHVDKDSCSIF